MGHREVNLTRTPYLVLFVILISIGISSAYAITITLGGDPVIINGILDLMGNKITNVGTPTLATDAATKGYVDSGSPGSGTVTSVGSGTGLTGGPITSSGSLSIDTAVVPQLGAVNTFTNTMEVQAAFTVVEGTFTTFQDAVIGGNVDVSGNLAVGGVASGITWNSRVPQSTSLFTVDSAGIVGQHTSITIGTDGLPVISYYYLTNNDLKVVHCGNASCTSGNTLTTVDNAAGVGEFTSITIGTDGLPVISYYDATNGDLKVAHCENASCSSGSPTITIVDNAAGVGQYTSITIGIDGLPVISYYDATNGDLKVAHCSTITCAASTLASVNTANDVGLYTSITIGTDGLPVISYFDTTIDDLKVTHCGNASCTSGNSVFDVDTTGSVGFHTSITIGTDGLPVISYYDFSNFDLKVAHCSTITCIASTTTTVDSAGFVGLNTSITIGTDGLPVISYRDDSNSDLKVVHCTNTSCSTFDTPTAVDSAGFVGRLTSITIGTDGLPVISYFDNTNFDLKVAKCTNPYCLNNWIRR